MKTLNATMAILFAIALTAATARADVVGNAYIVDKGSIYTLTISTLSDSIYNYQAVLSINTSGFDESLYPNVTLISAVNFKATNDVLDAKLVSTTAGLTTDWSVSEKNISNGGCSGGGSGYVCSETESPVAIVPDHTYTWTWNFTADNIFPDQYGVDLYGAHIGAKYNNADFNLNGVITSATNVPEPSTLLLLGSGLLGLGGFAWRRNRKG